jgi:hypothetical protein
VCIGRPDVLLQHLCHHSARSRVVHVGSNSLPAPFTINSATAARLTLQKTTSAQLRQTQVHWGGWLFPTSAGRQPSRMRSWQLSVRAELVNARTANCWPSVRPTCCSCSGEHCSSVDICASSPTNGSLRQAHPKCAVPEEMGSAPRGPIRQ